VINFLGLSDISFVHLITIIIKLLLKHSDQSYLVNTTTISEISKIELTIEVFISFISHVLS